jgi:predicted NACHT family NTPase
MDYPENRVIVTSRILPGSSPEDDASSTQWNPPPTFVDAHLEEMSNADISNFIEHWHDAVDRSKLDEFEFVALLRAKEELPKKLEDPANRRIRELCSTPLLCALVCVLHWREEGYLPRQRVDLYNRCCDMLIEARDLKRGVQLPSGPLASMTKNDKEMVLQRLAFDMMHNKPDSDEVQTSTYRMEIGREKALDWISPRIASFQDPEARQCTAEEVLDHLIERTGLLREPAGGLVDFPHRTFQEYLAACAAGGDGQEDFLAKQADDDQWHETIMLAAGTTTDGVRLAGRLLTR